MQCTIPVDGIHLTLRLDECFMLLRTLGGGLAARWRLRYVRAAALHALHTRVAAAATAAAAAWRLILHSQRWCSQRLGSDFLLPTGMLAPAFNVSLGVDVLVRRATLGRFDGRSPAIAAASSGGTVHLHWPHAPDRSQVLRLNHDITSVASGVLNRLSEESPDVLAIGTATNLLIYDVENNRDVFFKDVSDGVNALLIGQPSSGMPPLAFVGGNCSVQGFDVTGQEKLWTVTGDNVTSLAFCDVDNDGELEILVGSEDAEIRVYRQEELVSETTEADSIVDLTSISTTSYGYALSNGGVGVYNRGNRMWGVKTNHTANCISSFDLDGDGVPELLVGWDHGGFEVRREETGDIIFSDEMAGGISAIVQGDFRMLGQTEVIVVAQNGQMRGYSQEQEKSHQNMVPSHSEQRIIEELRQKKNDLLRELQNYESNISVFKSGKRSAGMIPPETEISCSLGPNNEKNHLEIRMKTSNDTLIKAVFIFGEGIFEEDSIMVVPKTPSQSIAAPLKLSRDASGDMSIQVVVGYRGSVQDHVFEMSHRLPRFASFVYCRVRDLPRIVSEVSVPLHDRLARVVLWLNQSFLLEYEQRGSSQNISVGFISMRTSTPLAMHISSEGAGQLRLQCDDMDLCGDFLQDLFSYLAVENLPAVADFPLEMEKFREVLRKVEEFNSIRMKMSVDIADSSNTIKSLVVRAEDARMQEDMDLMRSLYSDLYEMNRELMGEYSKRRTNHSNLISSLKEVNLMIQKAARLRVGKPQADVVAACRNAMKNNNVHAIINIIKQGHG